MDKHSAPYHQGGIFEIPRGVWWLYVPWRCTGNAQPRLPQGAAGKARNGSCPEGGATGEVKRSKVSRRKGWKASVYDTTGSNKLSTAGVSGWAEEWGRLEGRDVPWRHLTTRHICFYCAEFVQWSGQFHATFTKKSPHKLLCLWSPPGGMTGHFNHSWSSVAAS